MPPEPIAFDTSDEDEVRYPLRTHVRCPKRVPASDSEVDELASDSDADDAVQNRVAAPPSVRTEATNRQADKLRRKDKKKAKMEKRKMKKLRKEAAAKAVAPASSATRFTIADHHQDQENGNNVPWPPLTVESSDALEQILHRDPMTEDEVEILVTRPSTSKPTASSPTRASSLPVVHDAEEADQSSQRASSVDLVQLPRSSGNAENPIQLGSSSLSSLDTPNAPEDPQGQHSDNASVSDVSSIEYSDSSGYDSKTEFYTSSEGSLHGSDSEEGYGSWTERDQDKWQGSTRHLDAAYDGNYDVRAVLRHRRNPRRNFVEYRTVWAGYPIYSTTWEPESHFNSRKTLEEYWRRQGGRPASIPIDHGEYSQHDSDTDVAVARRPRKRAHEALKKKRREIRKDKVQLRDYLASLDQKRAQAKAKEEKKFEEFRRANHIELDTERTREKGTSRSYLKRLDKQNQKRWKRHAGIGASSSTVPSRFALTQANRTMADVSMKGRPASSIISARTRVSQLDDSIPEDDQNQIVFRRSAPGSGPNFPGLSFTTMAPAPIRPPAGSASARPIQASSAASSSAQAPQAPQHRPEPGAYKGAHKKAPKVQIKDNFGNFLNRLHGGGGAGGSGIGSGRGGDSSANDPFRTPNDAAAQPMPAPIDSNGQPITSKRRPSDVRKPNLLVLKPVQDFKGGSRPAASAAVPAPPSSSSSEAGDNDTFGIPEMSAVRSQFNPHQPVPDSDGESARGKGNVPSKSGTQFTTLQSRLQAQPHGRVEDPRRKPTLPAGDPRLHPQSAMSPVHDDMPWSPQEPEVSGWSAGSNDGRSPMLTTPRSPVDSDAPAPVSHEDVKKRSPRHMVGTAWFQFVVVHNHIEAQGAIFASEALPSERVELLGLNRPTLRFNKFLPFAWIRDILAKPGAPLDEAMLVCANGQDQHVDKSSFDQLSEQLKDSDIALLAHVDTSASGNIASKTTKTSSRTGKEQFLVVFSGKYSVDFISGVPPALQNVSGNRYTLCLIPLQLEHRPAPSELVSFREPAPLDSAIVRLFDEAVNNSELKKQHFGRNEIRKGKRAALRFGIVPQLYERIRDNYNLIFEGSNPPAYEKSALYYLIRIFQGGFRNEPDSRLLEDPKIGANVFVRRGAVDEILDDALSQPSFALAQYLRRLKRQPRCRFWTFGFSPEDPDERIREFFPGRDGLVSFSMSAILADLLRSSIEEPSNEDKEEGQLTQADNALPPSILCNAADHLAQNWRVRLHPWIRPCFKLLAHRLEADQLESVCRSLDLIDEQVIPIEFMLDLESKLELLYTSALVEQWPSDAINGLPFDEPTELPEQPADLIKQMDTEVFATMRKAQLTTAYDIRFHVLVSCPEVEKERDEETLAGVQVISLEDFGNDHCARLAKLPGNRVIS